MQASPQPNDEMTSNPTLEDEHLSLNSIYGDGTLSAPAAAAPDGLQCILRLPSRPSVSLRIFFPDAYPAAPPFVQGTHTLGDGGLPKGAGSVVVRSARDVLARVFQPGAPCLYDLAEELGEALPPALEGANLACHDDDVEQLQDAAVTREAVGLMAAKQQQRQEQQRIGPAPDWTLSDVITEKKSVFVGRCVAVSSVEEAQRCIAHLLATDKRAARATHNISAWRIAGSVASDRSSSTGTATATLQDFDDDGETAAGGRLLKLLQMMDVWGVVVVVSRWYGGILLGPARFAIINEAARDAVSRWLLGRDGATATDVKHRGKQHRK